MTTRTRYFVITSLLVLGVGVGTGLVAYYVGVPGGLALQAESQNLRLLPRDAHLVAYANVRRVMASELRQRLRTLLPISGQGQREIADQTGINIDTDIEEVLTCIAPSRGGQPNKTAPLALARGRFDVARLEGLMQAKGARSENYKGVKLIVAANVSPNPSGVLDPSDNFAVAFIEPELAALGSVALIRSAIDQRAAGPGVTGNADLMTMIRSLEGSDMWAVGDFGELASKTSLPSQLSQQLQGLTRFAASADINSGIRGSLRADTRDQASADDLRQVVQGLIAFGRLQLRSQPDLKPFLDSLALGGSGNTVSLTFDLPSQLIDLLGKVTGPGPNRPNSDRPAR